MHLLHCELNSFSPVHSNNYITIFFQLHEIALIPQMHFNSFCWNPNGFNRFLTQMHKPHKITKWYAYSNFYNQIVDKVDNPQFSWFYFRARTHTNHQSNSWTAPLFPITKIVLYRSSTVYIGIRICTHDSIFIRNPPKLHIFARAFREHRTDIVHSTGRNSIPGIYHIDVIVVHK